MEKTRLQIQHPDYQIETLLGQRDHSRVYRALHRPTEQVVVIKELLLGQVPNWKALDLFEREAKTLAHLQHPRIPRLLDSFEDKAKLAYYLVTEHVPGDTLAAKLEQGWAPTEVEVVQIAGQVLSILHYLHAFHPPLIHRDLKPSNLILNPENQVYMIDFGGVQEKLQPLGGGGSTVVGTFGYMAPEQFTGRATPQTDLYGLGATLIFLLTGRHPGQLPHRNFQPQFHSYVLCSAALVRWLDQLMRVNLNERFSSAEQALLVLEAETKTPIVLTPLPPPAQRRLASLDKVDTSQRVTEIGNQTSENRNDLPLLQGRFQIKKILAKGSSTQTYLCFDQQSQTEVVLKSLALETAQDWKQLELFQREIAVLQKLEHPQIPKFLDVLEESEAVYLVFEKVAGETLDEKLAQSWRLTEKDIWQIAEQMLGILDYLHGLTPPVIHRDLKPSNIMMQDDTLYLIDFGAVQEPLRPQGGRGSTVIGTYGYMAPEQFSGQAYPASDLYGLGVTLIHLMTRQAPENLPQHNLRLDYESYIKCSSPLKNWLDRLIDPRPNQRFQTAQQALKALKAFAWKQPNFPLRILSDTKPKAPESVPERLAFQTLKSQSGWRILIPPAKLNRQFKSENLQQTLRLQRLLKFIHFDAFAMLGVLLLTYLLALVGLTENSFFYFLWALFGLSFFLFGVTYPLFNLGARYTLGWRRRQFPELTISPFELHGGMEIELYPQKLVFKQTCSEFQAFYQSHIKQFDNVKTKDRITGWDHIQFISSVPGAENASAYLELSLKPHALTGIHHDVYTLKRADVSPDAFYALELNFDPEAMEDGKDAFLLILPLKPEEGIWVRDQILNYLYPPLETSELGEG